MFQTYLFGHVCYLYIYISLVKFQAENRVLCYNNNDDDDGDNDDNNYDNKNVEQKLFQTCRFTI